MLGADIRLTGLYVYPIKSCRGIPLQEAALGARGIRGDRLWMIVRPDGTFVTQRELPRLALVAPSFRGDDLVLEAPGMGPIVVSAAAGGTTGEVIVWRDRCRAVDGGAEAAAWLGDFLGTPCRLVRMADDFERQVDPSYAHPGDQVGFADGYPFLLATEASLADLNSHLAEPVPMNRFRPNLVLAGSAPFDEDGWKGIRIGEVRFRVVKPCARCVTTTVTQETGIRASTEPLATLAAYRRSERGALFGQNLIHDSLGVLRIGDSVEGYRNDSFR